MKLFVSNPVALNKLISSPIECPFLALMSYAFPKGKWEAKQVYLHPEGILMNCRIEKMRILLREAGYDADFCMDLQNKWEKLSKEEYLKYIDGMM